MDEVKEEVLQVLVSKKEKELIEAKSKEDNRSVSQYCRVVILRSLKEE